MATHNHFYTNRIIDKVNNNQNNEASIFYPGEEAGDPAEAHYLTEELNKLFESGSSIILETQVGFDDEGGDCYEAFLIKPEHIEHYNARIESLMLSTSPKSFSYSQCIMKYITEWPDNIITVWAGPY